MLKNIIFKNEENSYLVKKEVVNTFIEKPDFSFLVSFPRTGSHWLRLLMELYLNKPALVRAFYFPKAKDFSCYHTHDLDLTVKHNSVIYLLRAPGPTVFSQMKYHQQDTDDQILIKYWANIYGLHLSKWLIAENFTKKKTVICYDRMQKDLAREFEKICAHLGETFDNKRFNKIACQVNKKEIKSKTGHDLQVINFKKEYTKEKNEFLKKYHSIIVKSVQAQDSELEEALKEFYVN